MYFFVPTTKDNFVSTIILHNNLVVTCHTNADTLEVARKNFDWNILNELCHCYPKLRLRESVQIRVFPGPYFPVFSPNTGKKGPEKTPYLGTFHAKSPKLLFSLIYNVHVHENMFNPIYATGFIFRPLKISENQRFFWGF